MFANTFQHISQLVEARWRTRFNLFRGVGGRQPKQIETRCANAFHFGSWSRGNGSPRVEGVRGKWPPPLLGGSGGAVALLGGLGSGIGKVVGHGPGRNLDFGSTPRAVVLKSILQRLAWNYLMFPGRSFSNQSFNVWLGTIPETVILKPLLQRLAWNYSQDRRSQTNPLTSGLGSISQRMVASPDFGGSV